MKVALWALQGLFAVYWVTIGILHFVLPPGLPVQMSWMYDLSTPLHVVSGTVEILGGLGLLLPAFSRRTAHLVPLAAFGLAGTMVGALGWHVWHGSLATSGPVNAVILLLMLLIAVGRTRIAPLHDRNDPRFDGPLRVLLGVTSAARSSASAA